MMKYKLHEKVCPNFKLVVYPVDSTSDERKKKNPFEF